MTWSLPSSAVPLKSSAVPSSNAQQAFAQIAYFADQAMGASGQNVNSYRATCQTQAPDASDALPDTTRLGPPY